MTRALLSPVLVACLAALVPAALAQSATAVTASGQTYIPNGGGILEAGQPFFGTGTRVYSLFEDCNCWYRGRIRGYNPATEQYTVGWWDDDETTHDFRSVLDVVTHAADFLAEVGENPKRDPQIYMPGTPVYYSFEAGWYWGTINDYSRGQYEIEWSDGSSGKYGDIRQVRTMVYQAAIEVITEGAALNVAFPLGTPVFYKFPDNWYNGWLSDYNQGTKTYTVQWADGTSDDFTDLKVLKQMADQAGIFLIGKEDVPLQAFPDGTLAFDIRKGEINGRGKVTGFDDLGNYQVTYDDGEVVTYSDTNSIIDVVNSAASLIFDGVHLAEGEHPQVFPIGTRMYYHFEEGWFNGFVSRFDAESGNYLVTWSDFSVGSPDMGLLSTLQMAIQGAMQMGGFTPDDKERWEIGTPVYYKFESGWYSGYISDYTNGGWYVITWDDGTKTRDDDPAKVMQMVNAALNMPTANKNIEEFPYGTKVYKEFEDGWYLGKITGTDSKGRYEVTYSDDTKFSYGNEDELRAMVQAAEKHLNKGMGSVGTAFLVLVILGLASGAAFFVYRRTKYGKEVPPPPPRQSENAHDDMNDVDLQPSSSVIS